MPKLFWTIKAIQGLTTDDINSLTEKELRPLVKASRKQVERRVRRIEDSGMYSHALEAYEKAMAKDYGEYVPDVRVMDRNQLVEEMHRHKSFLSARTSTVKGIKEVNREQDLRIFGAKRPGSKTPKYSMTEDERKFFWSIYNEFEEKFRKASFDSNRAQEVVQEEIDNLGERGTFGSILNNAETRLKMAIGPVYENGHRVSDAELSARYTSGAHDLDYWRKQLDSYF